MRGVVCPYSAICLEHMAIKARYAFLVHRKSLDHHKPSMGVSEP